MRVIFRHARDKRGHDAQLQRPDFIGRIFGQALRCPALISGLPEISINMRKSAIADLRAGPPRMMATAGRSPFEARSLHSLAPQGDGEMFFLSAIPAGNSVARPKSAAQTPRKTGASDIPEASGQMIGICST